MEFMSSSPTPSSLTSGIDCTCSALEVTRENLEDLLAYDDLFLDYFNAFLSLPVFPEPLVYDRLTGAFEEIDISANSVVSSSLLGVTAASQHYGPTNIEREKMLEWAKEERLPVFLKAQLFRELKLCKLLLRPLVDRNSASRGSSRQIRGYSRQSESYVSSLSNSAYNSADDALDDDDAWPDLRYSELYKYCRPGSRALSVPIKITYQDSDKTNVSDNTSTSSFSATKSAGLTLMRHTSNGYHRQQPLPPVLSSSESASRSKSSTAEAVSTAKRATRISSQVEVFHAQDSFEDSGTQSSRERKQTVPSSTEEAFIRGSRVLSAPVNYDYYLKRPFNNCDFDQLFGELEQEPLGKPYVTFEEEEVDEQQTEMDMRNLEGQLKITIQQLKEHVLGTYAGVEAFKSFLENTSGLHLLNFWLDCEFYKDMMEDENEVSCVEQRNILFRDIQDKYKFNLSKDAKDQIAKTASNVGLSHTIFLRTQYDILRRLRVYWVPRFLIHFERTKHFSPAAPSHRQLLLAMRKATPYNPVPFFPSISLVQSTPVRPDEIGSSSSHAPWNNADKSSTDNKLVARQTVKTSQSALGRSSKERFLLALAADRISGGPFEKYLAKQPNKNLMSNLLFWQDVTEYGATEDKSTDRLLRLQHAWSIYNKYLSEDSPHNIGLSSKDRDELYQNLLNARDFVESSVYDAAKYQAVHKLEDNWVRFLKEDLKAFLDCRVRPEGGSPPSTAEAIEIIVTNTDVVIKRPRPWVRRYPGSTMSERARRLQKALSLAEDMDEERYARNKLLRKEKRKAMERERRKAVRAAYRRQRENKLGAAKESKSKSDIDEGHMDIEDIEKDVPTYLDMHANKQVMAMFRKYLHEEDNKEMIHLQSLYNDLSSHADLDSKQRRDVHAIHIFKTYLDQQHSKKYIQMPENIKSKLDEEQDRPKTATINEMKKHVLTQIEECFKEFLIYQSEEFGVAPKDLATMSQAEIAMRMGSENCGSWKKKKGKGKLEEDEDNSPTAVEMHLDSVTLRVFENDLDSHGPTKSNREKRETKVSFSRTKYFHPSTQDRWGRSSRFDREDSRGSSMDNRSSSMSVDSTSARGRGRRRQSSGRSQPSREDKVEFLHSLGESAAGHLTIPMLYFYKYLVKHGQQDGMPQIDKDLFFYIEVQKFKAFNHAYSNEDLLKSKVQSMIECFLESVTPPTLQIDIPADCQSRTLKGANRYIQGKEMASSIFDEAQFAVFKELLPYWAGFRKNTRIPSDKRIPETKYQKMVRKRREAIENYQTPITNFDLPPIPEGAMPVYTISLSDGVRFKDMSEDSTVVTPAVDAKPSRLVASSIDSLRKSRRSVVG